MILGVRARGSLAYDRMLSVTSVIVAIVFLVGAAPAMAQQGFTAEARQEMFERLQRMAPEERQRFIEAMRLGELPAQGPGTPDVSRPPVIADTEEGERDRQADGDRERRFEDRRDGEDREDEERRVSLFGEFIDEDEATEELEDLTAIEQRVNRSIGTARLEVEAVPRAVRQRLKQFGYDLFKGAPTTFAPATEIPIPVDYLLGPGDTIEVQLYGTENRFHALTVNREGMVNIPEVGPVSVARLEFQDVREELIQRITEQIIGVNVSVSLGELRSMRVFVLGDVRRPGSYVVSSLSTMTNALFVSGGIEPIGSLRRLELKRSGDVVGSLDLYDLLLRGDTSRDQRLRPGDVIFVPPIGPTIGVAGEVRRPAIYELNQERTLSQVLALAGGLLPTAHRQSVQLEHVSGAGGRQVLDVDLTDATDLRSAVTDGDVVRIYSATERMGNVVLLSGHVQRPGGYEWHEGMRITDLIPSIDALLPASDPSYVLIRRELPPTGRVNALSVDLRAALALKGGVHDVLLEPRDNVFVFGMVEDRTETIEPLIEELRAQARQGDPEPVISVRGHVAHPGEYPLEAGMTVGDLIRAAGGLNQEAFTLEAELTRFELDDRGRGIRTLDIGLDDTASGQQTAAFELQPFDSLQIKPIPEWYESETIVVAGEVRFPGEYTIKRGETLSQLVRRAGGLANLAYPDGAIFSRELLRQREGQQIARLEEQLRTDLAQLSLSEIQSEGGNLEAIAAAQSVLLELQQTEPLGRLVIDLPAIRDGRADDVALRGGDMLFIPRIPQEVTVIGEVPQSTSHLFMAGLVRDDYLDRSGGTTAKADRKRIYIVRANGAVMASPRSRWFGSGAQRVEPGDVIVVPLDVTRLRPLQLWTSIAQIIQSLALTVAAANSVGAF